jgi:adenosine deaminase
METPAPASHPLVELHLHLEGCLTPARARALRGRRPHLPPPPAGALAEDRWSFTGLDGFLRVFGWAGRLLDGPEAYADLLDDAFDLLEAEGVVHAEFFLAVGMMRRFGHDPRPIVRHLAARAAAREEAGGVSARFVVDAVRQWGPDEAEAVLEDALALRDHRVVGVGVGGDERAAPAAAFSSFFRRARRAGLGTSLHAGEGTSPRQVAEALALGVDRIGHGIAAVEDPLLLERLAAAGTVLEVCPGSNEATGAWLPARGPHPALRMLRAGLRVVLGSDDPAFFDTSPRAERARLGRLGATEAELRAVERNAAAAAFLPGADRRALMARLAPVC